MENSNAYFEQQEAKYWSDIDEENIIKKIADCRAIIDNIEKTPAWKILVKDCDEKKHFIDEHWQDISDKKVLYNMRVKKNAVNLILNLKKNYEQDLERAQSELEKRKNTDKAVLKDWDTGG